MEDIIFMHLEMKVGLLLQILLWQGVKLLVSV